MLAKIVADIVVACSMLGAAFGLLDLLLSSEQKAKLSDASVRLWNWLDEAKQVSFFEMLRPRKVRIVLSLAAAISMLGTAASEYGYQDLALNLRSPIFAIGFFTAAIITFSIAAFTLSARTKLGLAVRTSICLAVLIVPLLVVVYSSDGLVAIVLFLAVWTLLVPFFFAWVVMFLPLAGIYLASALVHIAEFLMRRVAEYPKGVVLGLSVIVGSVAGLLKASS
jgi:hypothetical protein